MKQTGFYKLSLEYIGLVKQLGGAYRDNKERPVYCCMQDQSNPDIYWAVPTSDISHRTPAQLDNIKEYCAMPDRDIRSCYYHLGHTNRPAIFKISNVLPVTEKYMKTNIPRREYTSYCSTRSSSPKSKENCRASYLTRSSIQTNTSKKSLPFILLLQRNICEFFVLKKIS